MKATDLSALVASRLCHDLVSPVGAICNGLEIIAEEDDPDIIRQAVELLNMSARQAEYKLTFYRFAFGASASSGGEVPSRDVVSAATNFLGEEKTQLEWQGDHRGLSRVETRFLSNLLLLAKDCLPRGGTLEAGIDGKVISVVAKGQDARVREEVRAILSGSGDVPAPHLAPTVLLGAMADDTRAEVTVDQQPDGIRLIITL